MEAELYLLRFPMERVKPVDPLEEKIQSISMLRGHERWVRESIDQHSFSEEALNVPESILLYKQRQKTSYHEAGHEGVAVTLGDVAEISVKPEGRVGGYVRWMVNRSKGVMDQLFDMVTVSVASWVAEEMCGVNDHRGCGSDMGKARFGAALIYRLSQGGQSADRVINQAFSRARGILVGMGGSSYIMSRGDQVNREQTLGKAA